MLYARKTGLAVTAMLLLVGTAAAQDRKPAADGKEEATKELPIPQETTAVTQHQETIGGRVVHYTATAGNLLIAKEDHDEIEKPYHSVFYIAYTEDGADSKTRPVTFLYNGGPGSATIWLEMGSVGPVRVISQSPEPTNNPPFQVVPNEYSLLDKTDLVFIDAPGTGYSRPVGKGTIKDVAGVDEDLRAFTKFIIRYITVNQRWNSPKFLFGESYGTTRSAGLAATLNQAGVQLNGIVLLSSILNYNARSAGLDNEYLTDLPTFAAIAWYHNKIPNKPADVLAFIQQAREFSLGPYAEALYKGNAITAAESDKIATQLSGFTGLSVPYIKDANLRITLVAAFAKSCCAIRTRFSVDTTVVSRAGCRRRRRISRFRPLRHRHHRCLCRFVSRLPDEGAEVHQPRRLQQQRPEPE